MADLHLRDCSRGVVLFPPVAPASPSADVLRLGARSVLHLLVTGPPLRGVRKTAMLVVWHEGSNPSRGC